MHASLLCEERGGFSIQYLQETPYSESTDLFVKIWIVQNQFVFLQARKQRTAIMEVVIDSKIYQQASTYAQQQGLNLTSVIENFLVRFVGREKDTTEQAIPDVVLSLLGAGEKVAEDDLNAREAYYEYLEEKYK